MSLDISKFYRSKLKSECKLTNKQDLEFQIIEWFVNDEAVDNDDEDDDSDPDPSNIQLNEQYTIRCVGATTDGASVCCKITNFTPFYFVKVPDNFDRVKLNYFLDYIESSWNIKKNKHNFLRDRCKIVQRKDIYGFTNNKLFKFVRLVFNNYKVMMNSRYLFKKPVSIQNVNNSPKKYQLYESNVEPFMRFAHIKDIQMAGWLKLPKGKWHFTQNEAKTNIEVEIDWNNVVGLNDKDDIANFLQASWDIETYSYDRTFPDPKMKVKTKNGVVYPNKIFQIATTFKYYKDSDIFAKHLLTLKKCAKIDDPKVVVESFDNELDLIKRWISLIEKTDPDIFYTYNGDSFDCNYIMERARILGIEKSVLVGLSRLHVKSSFIKKEYFSSSAYGDNEYNRLYIPGRLNYDLMIHMKRGMKKYPSYKLDYISSEILKEGKHDLSAKEMFNYFDIGTPERIREIGLYCLQDTHLLQKIVDKQLILITIMQMANVTSVPIGFLTTRGQTIKVFSQILRKARQMNYLVPHINFNNDVYLLKVVTREEHGFIDSDVGKFVKVNSSSSVPEVSGDYRLVEVEDENTLIFSCDIEVQKDAFSGKLKGKHGTVSIMRLSNPRESEDDSFTGATVLEPKPGAYFADIVVEDFASLYPTIMMAYNLCFSSFVMDPEYLNIPGVKYENIEWDDLVEQKLKKTCEGVGKTGKSKGVVCGKQAFFEVPCNGSQHLNKKVCDQQSHFYCRIHDPLKKERTAETKVMKKPVHYQYTVVQPTVDENGEKVNQGVVPALLDELYSTRKSIKKKMAKAAAEGNKLLEDIYQSAQLAVKVSLNSVYGFMGRTQGNLILKPLASIVTYTGRKMIFESKTFAENDFLEHVKKNNLCTITLKPKKLKLSTKEKEHILSSFIC
jgi:DNA polymerase elongation subunit (family B)